MPESGRTCMLAAWRTPRSE